MGRFNKPYSLIELTTNLQSRYHKSIVSDAVDRLLAENKICTQNKVFYVNQELKKTLTDQEVKDFEHKINMKRDEISMRKEQRRTLKVSLDSIKNIPTDKDLKDELPTLKEEVEELTQKKEKLEVLTKGLDIQNKKKCDASCKKLAKENQEKIKDLIWLLKETAERSEMKPAELEEELDIKLL
eukprot:GHVP01048320.1.p1 GENE.GHVP01048320.1~~GHVP01048320.1.p1  ORF type:complete len:209 (-),score=49.03 GHVP01048320.1:264-812(-)